MALGILPSMRPLVLLIPTLAILYACSRQVPTRTISGLVTEGQSRVFIVPAGSADEKLRLFTEARDHDWKLAKNILDAERARLDRESQTHASKLAGVDDQISSLYGEIYRLNEIYRQNQLSAGADFATGLPGRCLPTDFTAKFGSLGSPKLYAAPAQYSQAQALVETAAKDVSEKINQLQSNREALLKAKPAYNQDLAFPGDTATLFERIESKPPSSVVTTLVTTATGQFKVTLPQGDYDLLVLNKSETKESGTFTVWKQPLSDHQILTLKNAYRTEALTYTSGGNAKPTR